MNLTEAKVTKQLDRVPPHDAGVELATLGAMIIEPLACRIATDELAPDHFYIPRHREAFEVLAIYCRQNAYLDEVTLGVKLQEMNHWTQLDAREFCAQLIMKCPSAGSIDNYCAILAGKLAERNRLQAAAELIRGASSESVRALLDTEKKGYVSCGAQTVFEQVADEIAGRRVSIQFPEWPVLSRLEALMPGTITLICGSPGVSKSFFILEPLWLMHFSDALWKKVAILELEKGAAYHVRRAWAQMAREAGLTNNGWVRRNKERVIELQERYRDQLEEMRHMIFAPTASQSADCNFLLDWMRRKSDEGCRILCIDPISIMKGQEKRFLDHENFVDGAMKIVERYQNNLICITHPRDMRGAEVAPALENIPGSKIWERCCDLIGWLEWHPQETGSFEIHGLIKQVEEHYYNRTFYDLKTRNAKRIGRIAYWFNCDTLRHIERGAIEDNS